LSPPSWYRLLPRPGSLEGFALIGPESLPYNESVDDLHDGAEGRGHRRAAFFALYPEHSSRSPSCTWSGGTGEAGAWWTCLPGSGYRAGWTAAAAEGSGGEQASLIR
jgi:hypothetical protein